MRGVREDTMDSATVTFLTTEGDQSISVCDIVYIESQKNYFMVYCINALPYRCRGTISQACQLLKPYPFYRVHAAYLVNMEKVRQVCGGRIIRMCDGSLIYAGQKRYSAFRKAYLRYTSAKGSPEPSERGSAPEQTAKLGTKKLGMLLLIITLLLCGLFAVIAYATDLFVPLPPAKPAETLPATAIPVKLFADGIDYGGFAKWFDPYGKRYRNHEPSSKEKAQQFLDDVLPQPNCYDTWMSRKEELLRFCEELRKAKNVDELVGAEKDYYDECLRQLNFIYENLDGKREVLLNGDNRVWVNLYEQLARMYGEIARYEKELKNGENPEIAKEEIAICEKKLAVYEHCIEMYEQGEDELTVLTYMYAQLRDIN